MADYDEECRLGGECPCAYHYGRHGSTFDEVRAERDRLRAQVATLTDLLNAEGLARGQAEARAERAEARAAQAEHQARADPDRALLAQLASAIVKPADIAGLITHLEHLECKQQEETALMDAWLCVRVPQMCRAG